MTDDPQTGVLADRVANALTDEAEEIVVAWIAWVREALPSRALSDHAIRDHVPPVLHAIARYVRTPLELFRTELVGHLELHAQLRWEQGYGVEELLAEFDGLAELVGEFVLTTLAEATEPPLAVAQVTHRVGAGLRAVGHVAVSLYRETEHRHQRELSRQLDDFAHSIAHEIRGPLQAAKLGISVMDRPEISGDPKRRADHLALVSRSLVRAEDLLDDLRVLAVAQAAKSDRVVDAAGAVLAVRDELRAVAAAHNVRLEIEGELPEVRVASVPFQLSLFNLLSNSIKYADPRKPDRWCVVRVARVRNADALDRCVVTVTDNGLGIQSDMLHTVFQRHVRAHPAVAEGTGLGLPIARQVLQQHSGTIQLESHEGEGTTVRFDLPVVVSSPERRTNHSRSTELDLAVRGVEADGDP